MPAVYAACKVAQFSFPLLWVSLNRRIPPSRVSSASGGLLLGALSGIVIVVLMWSVYLMAFKDGPLALAAEPRVASRIAALGAASPGGFLALTVFLSVFHSFLEEYYWRWFLFGRLRTHIGAMPANVLSSAAFTGHHVIVLHAFMGSGANGWLTAALSMGVALAGMFWAWAYARSGSLVSPWLSHVLVDLGIMAIGYDVAGLSRS